MGIKLGYLLIFEGCLPEKCSLAYFDVLCILLSLANCWDLI
jgi:hypothetical protein